MVVVVIVVWWWWSGRDDLKMGGVERSHHLKTVQMWSLGHFVKIFERPFSEIVVVWPKKLLKKVVKTFFNSKSDPHLQGRGTKFWYTRGGSFVCEKKKNSSDIFF